MKKIHFENSQGLRLSGILHIPEKDSRLTVIISHGFTANKDRPRIIETANALSYNGFTALRFDFEGCGESEDREITVKGQVDDLRAAISYLRGKGYDNLGLLGESLGGLISVLAYDENIETMVLWHPVTASKKPGIIKKEELQQELNKKGYLIYIKDNRNFKIPKQYIEERSSINQEKILSRIKCPVLIIHGDKDSSIPLEHSKKAMQYLDGKSKLEILKGENHKIELNVYLDKIIPLSVNWFKRYLH